MRRFAILAVLVIAGCTSSGTPVSTAPPGPTTTAQSTPNTRDSSSAVTPPASSSVPPARSTTQNSVPPASSPAQQLFARMTEAQRIGQMLMVDCPSTGASSATAAAIANYHVGSVILDGTTQEGLAAVQQVTTHVESINPSAAKLFIATDQEGGLVQRLQGSGFGTIPSAVQQGQLAPSALRADAQVWGEQLRHAGVTVNLAPVLDTVPAGSGPNPPIGDLDRQYGSTPSAVKAHGLAYAQGMTAAGIDVTVKHFPGLGRVTGNTDVSSGVTDSVTTRHDPYLKPFRAAARAQVPFVMISTAIYSRIDPGVPAAFSRTIVTGMLRHDLGYRGLIISDDLGGAKQVADRTPGQRAVDFVAAGGDVVLTVNASQAGEMIGALLAKANSSAAFKQKVDAAALLVLQAKQARGLLS
jgi:beta-N-acetylhexosaminidase